MRRTPNDLLAMARERYRGAQAAFAAGKREQAWVDLLAVVCCVAAANGQLVDIDAVQMARDLGAIK